MAYRWKAQSGMTSYDFASAAIYTYESSRNTDPGIANVKSGTSYKIKNSSLTGTYAPTGAASGIGSVKVSSMTATTVTLEVDGTDTNFSSMKVGYRTLKRHNPSVLSYSTAISSPAIGDTVTISSLTENNVYEMVAIGYESGGSASEPGSIIIVRPGDGSTHIRQICASVKDYLTGDTLATGLLNSEIDTIEARAGVTLEAVKVITDTTLGVETEYPAVEVAPVESADQEKIGNRKFWTYYIDIVVHLRSRSGDARTLEQNIEYYMEAIENCMDEDDTIGSTVYEAEIERKTFPPSVGDEFGILYTRAILTLKVEQTN